MNIILLRHIDCHKKNQVKKILSNLHHKTEMMIMQRHTAVDKCKLIILKQQNIFLKLQYTMK